MSPSKRFQPELPRSGRSIEPGRWVAGQRNCPDKRQYFRSSQDCDIFVGILWSRFGTPTIRAEIEEIIDGDQTPLNMAMNQMAATLRSADAGRR